MSTGKKISRDLIEEAKKRIVFLLVCVFGLSYLMSLTSSSVWVNLPAAATLIIFLRYVSHDLDVRRRTVAHSEVSSLSQSSHKRDIELPNFPLEKSSWRRKVNSPAVEAAIDQFTRHLVSEWMTDLWYSRITPDKDGPEELVCIMNDVLGEVSCRARDINLISLLTRDVVNLFCDHLDIYRTTQAKIGKQLGQLSVDCRDTQLRLVLAAENKLHPALFSVKAEHKVLQLLMSGLISCTFKPQDLECSFFRYTVRELLACAIMRPILNLANPRVINEKIESLVLSFTKKADKGGTRSAEEASMAMSNGPSRTSSDHSSGFLDRSTTGVELVQFKHNSSRTTSDEQMKINGRTRDPQISQANLSTGIYDASLVPTNDKLHIDAQISQSSSSLPLGSEKSKGKNGGSEWGQMLDIITRRKTQALAPENIENMWTKGRNYKKKEDTNQVAYPVIQNTLVGVSNTLCHSQVPSNQFQDKIDISKRTTSAEHGNHHLAGMSFVHGNGNQTTHTPILLYRENLSDHLNHENLELESESSYPTEEEESSTVTGLDSPGTRVWDSKNKRNGSVSHIRHPLENFEVNLTKRSGKGHSYHPRIARTKSGRKRSRSTKQKVPILQEVERTSFELGDDQDILNESQGYTKVDELNDDPEVESWGRVHSGAAASSSTCSIKVPESCISSMKSSGSFLLEDSFLKLRCEVLGANVVKSGSGTFAVYSIAVTDVNNNSWSIKRRFRHFEELHRHLKEFPEYNLSLPPKHFLSSGLDAPVIEERCKLLDKYLKMLLQLPTVSGSIEVWDFLSVDSQTYSFPDSLSIIHTLSVDLDGKPCEVAKIQSVGEAVNGQLYSRGERLGFESKESFLQTKNILKSDNLSLKKRNKEQHSAQNSGIDGNLFQSNSGSDPGNRPQLNASSFSTSEKPENAHIKAADGIKEAPQSLLETVEDPTIPIEWVPPNLSMPILDLVDVIFQLQDGGWIRRQAFWIAKQVLHLGMGDAFDDWLIEKIQLLRKGSVIASGIMRIEQILWPDGIFITKHPNRKRPTPLTSPKEEGQKNHRMENNVLTPEEQLEAARRAKFVYELMIDKAPAALVGLVGRKEYERCAQDVYFFLQSSVCLKQLAFELVELLLLAAFPELDDVVRRFHEEKEQFGAVEE